MAPKSPIGPRFDLTGQVFGRLTVLKPVRSFRNGKPVLKWECRCECGKTKMILTARLRNSDVRSCGCLRVDEVVKTGHQNRKHGESGFARDAPRSPEYRSWRSMRNRCLNPKGQDWVLYGGRGIKICKRWESFENFLADMGRRPSAKHSLDRYPNRDGDYKPSNCRWASSSEQNKNRRPFPRHKHTLETRIKISETKRGIR